MYTENDLICDIRDLGVMDCDLLTVHTFNISPSPKTPPPLWASPTPSSILFTKWKKLCRVTFFLW